MEPSDKIYFDTCAKKLSEIPFSNETTVENVSLGKKLKQKHLTTVNIIMSWFLADMIPTFYPLLFDYFIDVQNKVWSSWESLVPKYIYDSTCSSNSLFVETVDTLKTNWFLNLMKSVIILQISSFVFSIYV